MITLVLLPGMDGTGTLFNEFTSALPANWKTVVVEYPRDRILDYHELTEHANRQLPEEPFYLLGESFSGPVAIALASKNTQQVLGLILVCTFAASPMPALSFLRPLLAVAPSPTLLSRPLGLALMGRHSTPELRAALHRAISSVAPAVLRHRAASALQVNVTAQLRAVTCPVLYLQATEDRVVQSSSSRLIAIAKPGTQVVPVPGPHFLLQVQPGRCSQAVQSFVCKSKDSDSIDSCE